jgi:hypothetical protein
LVTIQIDVDAVFRHCRSFLASTCALPAQKHLPQPRF